MLTEKQRRFCEEYLKNGGHATNAYLTAYNSDSPKSAVIEASRLLKRDDIQDYLMKLRKPVEKAVKRQIVRDRQSKIELIQRRIDACEERDDDAGIARYLEIWNKMDGEYLNANKGEDDDGNGITGLDTHTLLQLVNGDQLPKAE